MSDEKMAEIELQLEQLKARRQLLAARQNKRTRSEDTRRKILAGAVVLEEARQNLDFRNWLCFRLDQKLTRGADRKLFNMSSS